MTLCGKVLAMLASLRVARSAGRTVSFHCSSVSRVAAIGYYNVFINEELYVYKASFRETFLVLMWATNTWAFFFMIAICLSWLPSIVIHLSSDSAATETSNRSKGIGIPFQSSTVILPGISCKRVGTSPFEINEEPFRFVRCNHTASGTQKPHNIDPSRIGSPR